MKFGSALRRTLMTRKRHCWPWNRTEILLSIVPLVVNTLVHSTCGHINEKISQKGSVPCPSGWLDFQYSCYWFYQKDLQSMADANETCAAVGATLVSVNDRYEAEFIADRLLQLDIRRMTWHTSGVFARHSTSKEWQWLGDNSNLCFNFWHNATFHKLKHLQSDDNVVIGYTFANGTYSWELVNKAIQGGAICEIRKSQIQRLQLPTDALTYGIRPGAEIPKGPRITEQPESIVHYAECQLHNVATLNCSAEANPSATYAWFKDGSKRIEPALNHRYTINGGQLVIEDVSAMDYGEYYCLVSNSVGTARSQTVSLNPAFMKQFPKSRMDIYATEGKGKAISCDEPSHFPVTLGYAWMKEASKEFISESERIFQSRDGTLYFASIHESDDLSYACSIVNSVSQMGRYGPFFHLHVTKSASGNKTSLTATASPPAIPEEFPKVFPETPEYGSSLTIECFAYSRSTNIAYSWERVDGHRNLNATFSSFKRRLTIPKMDMTDFGTYRCTVTDPLSNASTSRDVTVPMKVHPVVTWPLENFFAHPKETAEFKCAVYALPAADFEWFRNGRPINPLLLQGTDVGRFQVLNDKLIIKRIVTTDAGIYQCFASNPFGQASSSAQLIVRTFAPTFAKQATPGNNTAYAIHGSSVKLPCTPDASPRASISWNAHSGQLRERNTDSGRFTLFSDGSLQINKVGPQDQGQYVCAATNELGSASLTLLLKVLKPIRVSIEPQTTLVDVGSSISLKCRTEPSTRSLEGSRIAWTINDQSIDELADENSNISSQLVGESHMLTIQSVAVWHSGVIVCHFIGPQSITAAGSAVVTVRGPPAAPIQLSTRNEQMDSVLLSWSVSPVAHSAGIERYKIESRFRVNGSSEGWSSWQPAEPAIVASHPVVVDYKLKKLKPFRDYEFRLYAGNNQGWSEPSLASSVVQTLPGKPVSSPKNFRDGFGRPGEMLLLWEPLEQHDWGSFNVSYKLSWYFSDDGLQSRQTSVEIAEGNADAYVIKFAKEKQDRCLSYHVTLVASNAYGDGPAKELTLFPVLNFTAAIPVNVSATALNETAVSLGWDFTLPDSERMCKRVLGFRIKYSNQTSLRSLSNAQSTYTDVFLRWPLNETSVNTKLVLSNLLPATLYNISIAAITHFSIGEFSVPMNVTTRKSAPKSVPQSLAAVQKHDQAGSDAAVVLLTWKPISTSIYEEPLDGYKLLIYRDGDDSQNRTIQQVIIPIELVDEDKELAAVEVVGLETDQSRRYSLQLLAYSAGGDGAPTKPVAVFVASIGVRCFIQLPKFFYGLSLLFSLIVQKLI